MIRLVPLILLMGLLFAVDKEGKKKTQFDVTGIVIGENGEGLKKVKLTIFNDLGEKVESGKTKKSGEFKFKKIDGLSFFSNNIKKFDLILIKQTIHLLSFYKIKRLIDIRKEINFLLKSKEIGEDEEKSYEKNVQNITDKHIEIVESKVSSKEKAIMKTALPIMNILKFIR